MTEIVVTGIGFITLLGDDLAAVHQAICKGQTGLATSKVDEGRAEQLCGKIKDFDAADYLRGRQSLRPLNRAARLLASATQLALDESGLDDSFREANDIGLAVGTTYCSLGTISQFDCRAQREGPKYASALDFANTVLNSAAGQTAIWHNLRGCNSTLSAGSASSLGAVSYAADLLRSGKEDVLIAGGLEELSPEALIGYQGSELHCPSGKDCFPIPLDKRRNGFVVGEGAVMFVLERRQDAINRGIKPIAKLMGVGEAFCVDTADSKEFESAVNTAMNFSIDAAGVSKDQVSIVSLSANGSVDLDSVEAKAATNFFGESLQAISIECCKAAIGESFGAGGAIQLALLIQSLRTGTSPGVANFSEASSGIENLNVTRLPSSHTGNSGLVSSISADGHCLAAVVST